MRLPPPVRASVVVLVASAPRLLKSGAALVPASAEVRAESARHFVDFPDDHRLAALWNGHLTQLLFHVSVTVLLAWLATRGIAARANPNGRSWFLAVAAVSILIATSIRSLALLTDRIVFADTQVRLGWLGGALEDALLLFGLLLLIRLWPRVWPMAALAVFASFGPLSIRGQLRASPAGPSLASSVGAPYASELGAIMDGLGLRPERVRTVSKPRCSTGTAGLGTESHIVLCLGDIEKTGAALPALLAHELGHIELGHNEHAFAIRALKLPLMVFLLWFGLGQLRRRGLAASVWTQGASLWAIQLGAVAALSLGEHALTRERELAADRWAAERVSTELVVEWLRQLPRQRGNDPVMSLPQRLTHSHPSALERIENVLAVQVPVSQERAPSCQDSVRERRP